MSLLKDCRPTAAFSALCRPFSDACTILNPQQSRLLQPGQSLHCVPCGPWQGACVNDHDGPNGVSSAACRLRGFRCCSRRSIAGALSARQPKLCSAEAGVEGAALLHMHAALLARDFRGVAAACLAVFRWVLVLALGALGNCGATLACAVTGDPVLCCFGAAGVTLGLRGWPRLPLPAAHGPWHSSIRCLACSSYICGMRACCADGMSCAALDGRAVIRGVRLQSSCLTHWAGRPIIIRIA